MQKLIAVLMVLVMVKLLDLAYFELVMMYKSAKREPRKFKTFHEVMKSLDNELLDEVNVVRAKIGLPVVKELSKNKELVEVPEVIEFKRVPDDAAVEVKNGKVINLRTGRPVSTVSEMLALI